MLRAILIFRKAKFHRLCPYIQNKRGRIKSLSSILLLGAIVYSLCCISNLCSTSFASQIDSSSNRNDIKSHLQWKANLSNGLTVDLIGVCRILSTGKQWWRPNGRLLMDAPYDKLEGGPYFGEFEFLIRIDGQRDSNYRWKIQGASSLSSTCTPVNKEGNLIDQFKAVAAHFPSDQNSTDLRFGVAVGHWKTSAIYSASNIERRCLVANGFAGGGVIFSDPYEHEDQSILVLVHTFPEFDARIIAIGIDGSLHKTVSSSKLGVRGIRLLKCWYNLPLSKIKEFCFQTRKYEWVEFKEVSLKAGNVTNTRVVTNPKLVETLNISHYEDLPDLDKTNLNTHSKELNKGQSAPLFVAKTPKGKPLRLIDYRGKYVLLDFWATWCRPCVQNLPKLQKLYYKYKDKDFMILGIHSSHKCDNLDEFVRKHNIPYPIAIASEEMQTDYGITAWPTYILLDKQGKITSIDIGILLTDKQIEAILRKHGSNEN